MIFLSSQASLSSKKSWRNWRKKKGNRVTIIEKRVTIWSSQESCIRHWWKCVTMAKTWHDYGNPNLDGLLHKAETCHGLLKSCHDFRSCCCLFKLKTILKTRVTIWAEQSAILRLQDGQKGDFFTLLPAHVCIYSSNDYVICKHHYE